jgi:hypothetical protein
MGDHDELLSEIVNKKKKRCALTSAMLWSSALYKALSSSGTCMKNPTSMLKPPHRA